MRDFIFLLIKAKKIASDGDSLELKAFLKNIGSNFILQGKKFGFLAEFEWNLALLIKAHPYWLPGWDSNPRPIGYTIPTIFIIEWTISSSAVKTEQGASLAFSEVLLFRIVSEPFH